MTDPPFMPDVRELALSPSDPKEGIDHRWDIRWPDPKQLLGFDRAFVIHVRAAPGGWAGPATYICSDCYADDPRQPVDEPERFCKHVQALRSWLAARRAEG